MLPNGADIVPITPELAAPQLLFDTGDTGKDFARGQTLDDPDNLGWAVGRYGLDEKMHVVPIGPNFDERDLIALGNF